MVVSTAARGRRSIVPESTIVPVPEIDWTHIVEPPTSRGMKL
jgi:hypothetical protein